MKELGFEPGVDDFFVSWADTFCPDRRQANTCKIVLKCQGRSKGMIQNKVGQHYNTSGLYNFTTS